MPYYKTASSKQISFNQIDAPNSTVYVNNLDGIDCNNNNYKLLKENLMLINNTECLGVKDLSNNRCIGGSYNVRRSASTVINKKYYTNHTKYLQNRCKTYEKNKVLGEKVIPEDEYAYNCTTTDINNCRKKIIYKPSNRSFMTQGAVTASTSTHKKKYNAIKYNPRTPNKDITTDDKECQRIFKSCKKT